MNDTFKLKRKIEQLQNRIKFYEKNIGCKAMMLGTPFGSIACPNCGVVSMGKLTLICELCDQSFFDEEEIKYALDTFGDFTEASNDQKI